MTLRLTGEQLTIQDIRDFLAHHDNVEVTEDALQRVKQSRATVERIIQNKETIYGITTGFGLFSDVLIDQQKYNQLQVNLIRSHACGVGAPFADNVSLVMMVLRLNTLLKGHSGVTRDLVEQLTYFINERIIPVIPQQGSLGASGDLAPLSHLALALIGEGRVSYKGEILDSAAVLKSLHRQPLTLQAKEGLALINGTQAMTAQGVITFIEAESLGYEAEWIAALTHQALNGITDAYNENVHIVRNFEEQTAVARRMSDWLEGSKLTTRQGEIRVQDPYTLRCIPQIHGASFQVFNYVRE
ncbi:histidine ammonia-lyase, partial [Staphylococcus agnetis]